MVGMQVCVCVHILCNSFADGSAKQTEDVLTQPQNRNITLDKQGIGAGAERSLFASTSASAPQKWAPAEEGLL